MLKGLLSNECAKNFELNLKKSETFFWEITLDTWYELKLSMPNVLEAVTHLFYRKGALKNYTKFS